MGSQAITFAAGAAFAALLFVFAITSFRSRRLLSEPSDFLHFAGEQRNFIKLLVATISVGTGLSYAMSAGDRNGMLILQALWLC